MEYGTNKKLPLVADLWLLKRWRSTVIGTRSGLSRDEELVRRDLAFRLDARKVAHVCALFYPLRAVPQLYCSAIVRQAELHAALVEDIL
eukprot:1335825-Amphidinium_carterae.2